MDRRTFLVSAVGLAGTTLMPGVRGLGPEALYARAEALRRGAENLPPAEALREARTYLGVIDTALRVTPWAHQRVPLHRAAALTAFVAARTARWGGWEGPEYLSYAEAEARAADDGPLLAQVWLERASREGADALALDVGSPTAFKLIVAALDSAGSTKRNAHLRASARFRLAWEYAAEGNERAALMELDCAAIEAEHAGSPATWVAARRGSPLRRLGRFAEAEAALTRALAGPPVRRTSTLADLARLHTAQGDADAAAAALEEAFLLVRSRGLVCRQPRLHAARVLLPDCPAVRQLDAVMHG